MKLPNITEKNKKLNSEKGGEQIVHPPFLLLFMTGAQNQSFFRCFLCVQYGKIKKIRLLRPEKGLFSSFFRFLFRKINLLRNMEKWNQSTYNGV